MFADDTNVFASHENLDIVINEANTELATLADWFKSNKLSLNSDKTKYMISHPLLPAIFSLAKLLLISG